MASAAYSHLAAKMDLPDLLWRADDIRALETNAGWVLILASIDAHRERLLAQLLNPGAKTEDVDRLRGEILGLQSAHEAAQTIVRIAEEREAAANQRIAQEHA